MRLHQRVHRSERGAFLLLFAFCLVFLLTLVAFAVDLGTARLENRSNQQLVDLATLAAGPHLAGYGAPTGVSPNASPFDACVAAVGSVQDNADDFRPKLGLVELETACRNAGFYDPFASPPTGVQCVRTDLNPAIQTLSLQRGPYNLNVIYPVRASDIADARFDSSGGANDGDNHCARMKIDLRRTDQTSFAGVIGVDEVKSHASAVVKGTLGQGDNAIPAFLLLERYQCEVLTNSVGGSSKGIVVKAVDGQPGFIHLDSSGTGAVPTFCSNSTTQSDGVVLYGTDLPSGDPSVFVEPAGAKQGTIAIVASGVREHYGDGYNVTPTGGVDVVTRRPVDEAFYDSLGVNSATAPLHTQARSWVNATTNLGTTSSSWVEVDCDLKPTVADIADVLAQNWYVRCPSMKFDKASFDTAITSPVDGLAQPRQIVFSGNVSVSNNRRFDAPLAELVAVRGSLSVSGPEGDVIMPNVTSLFVGNGLTVSGKFRLGTTSLPVASGDSVATVCPADADVMRNVAIFFAGTGPSQVGMDLSGRAAFCDTTVYMSGNKSTVTSYSAYSDTTTSAYGCEPTLPCPATSTVVSNARYAISGLVEWTAPSLHDADDDEDDAPDPRGTEDLMFWSEAERDSLVSGNLVASGISMSPNMLVQLRSPAESTPRNAQFIARKLRLLQGTLEMEPKPNDSIDVPAPGSFSIIR